MALAVSEFVAAVRKSLIDFEGRVTRSEIYLTNVETNEEVHLCFTPEKIKVQSDVNFRTYNIVERGEISLPKGEKLDRLVEYSSRCADYALQFCYAFGLGKPPRDYKSFQAVADGRREN